MRIFYFLLASFNIVFAGCFVPKLKGPNSTEDLVVSSFDNSASTKQTYVSNKFFKSVTVNLGSQFSSQNICQGKIIFGLTGVATCVVGTNYAGVLPSTSWRLNSSGVIATIQAFPSSRSMDQILVGNEYSKLLGGGAKLKLVSSDPASENDGYSWNYGMDPNANYAMTINGSPPTVDCGLSGTVLERVNDCAIKNPTAALYDGPRYGTSSESQWRLVTRMLAAFSGSVNTRLQVWRDERTGLIWSDAVEAWSGFVAPILDMTAYNGTFVFGGEGIADPANNWNWYEAAGYASSTQTETLTYYNAQPATVGKPFSNLNCGTGCNGVAGNCTKSCQPSTPISLCAEDLVIAGTNGVATYVTPTAAKAAKGNIGYSDGVIWRLPSMADFKQAEIDGARMVLDGSPNIYWTSTSVSDSKDSAMGYASSGSPGNFYVNLRVNPMSVRCVGSVIPQ